MIYLKSITIENFKGIKRLDCEFDDLTVLAGLNNAGKSSILQAVHLIVGAVHGAKSKSLTERWHPSVEVRRIDLIELLSHFGIDDWQSLIPPSPQKVSVIRANFVNGLSIDLRPSLSDRTYFSFPMDDMELNREQIDALLSSSELPRSEPLTPPGDLPTRESMYEYRQYQNEVRSGQGPRLWRNGLWWALQQNGPESYQPLVTLVRKYFPEVELKLPRLASQNNHILVDYKEDNWGPFDVSQSGAGLRTFISLARMLQVSKAEIVLLDEPDSHLHASQQAIVLDLLEEAAQGNRQVILATHSPEVICRAPVESLRWVERGTEAVMGGDDTATMLERLGATPDLYLPLARHPEIIVYVEGKTDKPILESLIRWCRARHEGDLPSTLVIPHKDGRYEAVALQSIVRYRRETERQARVVGVRDLDWYYKDLPPEEPEIRKGDGYSLLTLQCKEIENLFCNPELLYQVFEGRVPIEELSKILDEESNADSLIDEWRFQLLPKIRERLPEKYEAATREREAESIFRTWKLDSRVRIRLVSGKLLLNHVVSRVKREHRQWCSPNRMLDRVQWLTPNWAAIAGAIFDGMVWPTSASGETGGLPTGASQAHRTVGRPEAG